MKYVPEIHHRRSIRLQGYDYASAGAYYVTPLHAQRPNGTSPGSVSAIMQNFISITTRKINQMRRTPGAKFWQRNYFERIIRNEDELNRVREYIINNPMKWELDRENPNNWKPI